MQNSTISKRQNWYQHHSAAFLSITRGSYIYYDFEQRYIVDRHGSVNLTESKQWGTVNAIRKDLKWTQNFFLKICLMSLIYNRKLISIFWICRLFYKLHTYIRIFWYGTTFKILAHCNSTLCTPQERNSRLLSTSWKKIAEAKKSGGREAEKRYQQKKAQPTQTHTYHVLVVPYELKVLHWRRPTF